MEPRIQVASLGEIQQLAAQAVASTKGILAFAGISSIQPAPNGLAAILRKRTVATLGSPGGLTLIKHAADFTIPSFVTKTSAVRQGRTVQFYAEVVKTTLEDATHESFYPGPGDHLMPGSKQNIGGRMYTSHWRITQKVSELIRQGEEEHLADAKRAYELTYKLIADTINAMVGQRFGPASSGPEAEKLAEAELAKRLPTELGTDPRNWVKVLNRLLDQTKEERDEKGWHTLLSNPPQTIGNKIIHLIDLGPDFRVGQVPSNQVVKY